MKVVLDANIIIAALLGSRGKIAIITSQNHEFYAPAYIVAEIRKHQQQICEKLGCSREEFAVNLEALLAFVKIVEERAYASHMAKATSAMEKRDSKDAQYVACALSVKADFIWTEDKDFTGQNLVAVKTTEEFIDKGKN